MAARLNGLAGSGRSLDLAFALEPKHDPEMMSCCMVVRRFCNEVWAATERDHPDPTRVKLSLICPALAGQLKTKPNPVACPTTIFGSVQLALARAGWAFKGPMQLIGRDGRVRHLAQVGPHRMIKHFEKDFIEESCYRALVKIDDRLLNQESRVVLQTGMHLEPIVKITRSRKYPHLRAAANKIVSGGVPTNFKLAKMGFDIDISCIKCDGAMDTVWHRCFLCPFVQDQARQALGQELFQEAIESDMDSLLFNRCMVPRPAHPACQLLPHPAYQFVHIIIR